MMNLEQKISESSEKIDEYLGKNNTSMHSYYEGKFDAYIDCRQLKQEIAELRAHVERLTHYSKEVVDWGNSIVCVYDNSNSDEQQNDIENLRDVAYSTSAQSLQQIKRDAVLEVAQKSLNDIDIEHITPARKEYVKQGAILLAKTIEEHANNLVKDAE